MPKGPVEDKDDIFVENLSNVLFLSMGVLSVSLSLILLLHSATVAVYSRQLPTDFSDRSIFAAVFFIVGFCSLYLFRKRRETRKKKQSMLFLGTKT